MRDKEPLNVGVAVQGLWLQYYELMAQSATKRFPLGTDAVLAIQPPPDDDLPEPGMFMVAT